MLNLVTRFIALNINEVSNAFSKLHEVVVKIVSHHYKIMRLNLSSTYMYRSYTPCVNGVNDCFK